MDLHHCVANFAGRRLTVLANTTLSLVGSDINVATNEPLSGVAPDSIVYKTIASLKKL